MGLAIVEQTINVRTAIIDTREGEVDSVSGHGLSLVAAVERKSARAVLRVDGVSKHYGVIEALAGVTFDIRQGEVFRLLGL